MREYQHVNTTILKFDIFNAYHEITHFISTRKGGFSNGAYEGLNLGFGTDDESSNVLKNRYLLAETLGTPLEWFVFPSQTHGNNVHIVTKKDKGKGALTPENAIPNTDALLTQQKHIYLAVQVADCIPILLFDRINNVIGCIHAGWRGIANNIIEKTISVMIKTFFSKPTDIISAIGPSIGACCYEIGIDVKNAIQNIGLSDIFVYNNQKIILDIKKAAYNQLINTGILDENIEISKYCTQCNPHLFFSSRYEHGKTGRFVAGIMLL